jgi:hypothetical protein
MATYLHRPNPADLPSEWKIWVAENRIAGVPDAQLAETLAASGYAGTAVAAVFESLQNDPYYLLSERSTRRLNKVKSLLAVRKSLAGLAHGSGQIERRSSVSRGEFLERYYAANRPLILTGMLAGSFAYRYWTPEYLAHTCGDVTIQVMAGRQSDPRYEINCEAHKFSVRLSQYVDMVLKGGATNDYYLVANNGFFAQDGTRNLFDEVPEFPEYLDHFEAQRKIFLWFGPAGTVTPLHHDVMNILVAQIYGRKRFTLIPPEDTPFIYNETGVFGEVDCGNPDYTRHPLYAQVRPLDVVLQPSEVLFLPVGWWHYVESLETSIMLSYINFSFPNEYQWMNP